MHTPTRFIDELVSVAHRATGRVGVSVVLLHVVNMCNWESGCECCFVKCCEYVQLGEWV